MNKQVLTPEQFIGEMNRQLLAHEDYEEGMAFCPYPEGPGEGPLSGYTTTGPSRLTSVYADIASYVRSRVLLLTRN